MNRRPPRSTLCPCTALCRSVGFGLERQDVVERVEGRLVTTAEIGVFGGSGFSSFLEETETVEIETPYGAPSAAPRSEEHTSELQSRQYLVCRLLLEKKKNSR